MIQGTLCLRVVEEVLCVKCVLLQKINDIPLESEPFFFIKSNLNEIGAIGLDKVVPCSIRSRVGLLNQGH